MLEEKNGSMKCVRKYMYDKREEHKSIIERSASERLGVVQLIYCSATREKHLLERLFQKCKSH